MEEKGFMDRQKDRSEKSSQRKEGAQSSRTGNGLPSIKSTGEPFLAFRRTSSFKSAKEVRVWDRRSAYDVIFPDPETGAQPFGDPAAGVKIDFGKGDDRGGHVGNVLLRLPNEILDCLVGVDAELRLAYLLVQLGVLSIQADADGINQAGKFGQYVSFVDEIGMAVRIDPDLAALAFHFGSNGLDHVEAQQRLAVPAEHDLGITPGVADLPDQVLGGRLLAQPEVVPLHEIRTVAHAEGAGRGAAVGDVEVERVPDGIGDLTALGHGPDAEKLHGIEARDAGHIVEGKPLDLRDHLRGMPHKGRLVPFSPHGLRREIGRIGLDQHMLDRDLPDDLPQGFGLGERDGTGDRDRKTHFDQLPCQGNVAGEAVHHAAQVRRPLLGQDLERVVVRLAVVDDDGQVQFPRLAQHVPELALLVRAGRMLVVVVEPDLAVGDHLLVLLRNAAAPRRQDAGCP